MPRKGVNNLLMVPYCSEHNHNKNIFITISYHYYKLVVIYLLRLVISPFALKCISLDNRKIFLLFSNSIPRVFYEILI